MKTKGTIAYVLGSAAAGGALYYGISRFTKSKSDSKKSGAESRRKMLVRVTENGRKYHRDECPLLHGETRVINVAEAIDNYEPCKACHPPGEMDNVADEAMSPKLAASRVISDANGTTARTNASAQMARELADSIAAGGENSASASKSQRSGGSARASNAAVNASSAASDNDIDALDSGADRSASAGDGRQGTGVQNDPVGDTNGRSV